MSSILDTLAGVLLVSKAGKIRHAIFWLPLAASIVLGAIVGSLFLRFIPDQPFRIGLSGVLFLLGLWFLVGRPRAHGRRLATQLPGRWTHKDLGITFLGGICGGLTGISGPPIIWHFGRGFAKQLFRQTLITVFLAAAVGRVITYGSTGLIDQHVVILSAVAIPGLLFGLHIGNKSFFRMSEMVFSRVAGAVLLIIAIRLFLQ